MNHVAFDVPVEKIDEYAKKLRAAGVKITGPVNHDDTDAQVSAEMNETTFVRSIYFLDPDGMLLEFAGWSRELTADDVNAEPMSVD